MIFRQTFIRVKNFNVNFVNRNLIVFLKNNCRTVFSISGSFDPELTLEMKKDIETFWRDKINISNASQDKGQKYYLLSMFPYPSGYLHMGHVRVYTLSDAIARFHRMRGMDVIHPIGWDAFGLPAENAAIEKNIHPAEWSLKNIDYMKKQLQLLNISFDWNLELSTCDPSYYKWTQYLFLLLYENGLAYKKEAVVNWDPVDKTVLADEQVDKSGHSWRSGCKVEKKRLEQWFLRTTVFAKSLYDGLNNPELVNWRDVKKIQQEWIGYCNGYTFHLKVFQNDKELPDLLPVWTDRPELVPSVTFIALSSMNMFNAPMFGGGNMKDGCCKLQIAALHPTMDIMLPIFVSDDFSHAPSTESIFGVPGAGDENCLSFAKRNNLNIISVPDEIINYNKDAKENVINERTRIIEKAMANGLKVHPSSKNLRDWLISRQRYWGTPIPIINCPNCKAVPVPFEDLPVELPYIKEFTGKGCSLASEREWLEVKCPKCKRTAYRETDTMDTFMDSSWYFLRYLDVKNKDRPFDIDKVKQLMPVDLYIGGKEHAAMHLFYARFMAHFLHSLGMMDNSEPFLQLLMQGMIQGQSYCIADTGKYIPKDDVDFSGPQPVDKKSGSPLIIDWEKMSKSKYNGVDPEEVIDENGIDTTRLFILGNVTPESPRRWNSELFPGIWKWQRKIWLTMTHFFEQRQTTIEAKNLSDEEITKSESFLKGARNYYTKGATHCFRNTRQISVAISKLQGLTADLRGASQLARNSQEYQDSLAALLIMLAPVAPHFASELWSIFSVCATPSPKYDLTKPVLQQKWPTVDEDFDYMLNIYANDRLYDAIPMKNQQLTVLDSSTAINLAMNNEKLKKALQNSKLLSLRYRRWPEGDGEVVVYFYQKKTTVQKDNTMKQSISK